MLKAYLSSIVIAVSGTLIITAETCAQAAVEDDVAVAAACAKDIAAGLRPIADLRTDRFQGKGTEDHVRCNGGEAAVARMGTQSNSMNRTIGGWACRAKSV
jgi:hypothetical protein